MATRRFMLIENRLSKNIKLKADYTAFIKEFIDLGHLELVPSDEVHKPTGNFAYLPHHAVFKESSTTTKVRVVFDGSAQRDKISLNNSLLVGPKIQDDIFDILLRFRTHKVALSADVAKMYRQITPCKTASRLSSHPLAMEYKLSDSTLSDDSSHVRNSVLFVSIDPCIATI